LIKTEFEIDENDGLAARVQVSKLVVAFESAKARTTKQAEMEGEAEIREQPQKVPSQTSSPCALPSKSATGL